MLRFPILRYQRSPQTFHQVTVKSKHLTHPNIVPLLGVTIDPPQLISDWMSGGNLMEYITKQSDVDRLRLVGVFSGSFYEALTPSPAVRCC